ncbi:hypothetical protein [Solirubrum puertoriconensis]|uniref:Uncharacterized protein n=1 Tax=Solirubrum puertoriconensis TaxID=1751427 RepID=A0A9X0L3J8_SOLP1|nr:hypothetical protein [Solirubrum puertoriconensis]KUG06623.1 hypothetical protein ASU33_04580 [Solirubrum puertoriconensis]
MTFQEFEATLGAKQPPATLPLLLRALWLERNGQWSGAHDIAQRDEADPLFCWLHAYLHRREGDLGNAGHWYRRAGRTGFAGTEAEEWQALAQAALGKEIV